MFPTTQVTVQVRNPDGTIPRGASISALLVDSTNSPTTGYHNQIVVPTLVQATPDAQGNATLSLWPNSPGTQYRITLSCFKAVLSTAFAVVATAQDGLPVALLDLIHQPLSSIDGLAPLAARVATLEHYGVGPTGPTGASITGPQGGSITGPTGAASSVAGPTGAIGPTGPMVATPLRTSVPTIWSPHFAITSASASGARKRGLMTILPTVTSSMVARTVF